MGASHPAISGRGKASSDPVVAVVGQDLTCAACGRALGSAWRFRFVLGSTRTVLKCARCALRHPPLVRKALTTALVVGTILTVINQGDALLTGQLTAALSWKIPLTYFVPYAVSTYSALEISRISPSSPRVPD
jgi:hypothetical protein